VKMPDEPPRNAEAKLPRSGAPIPT